MEMPIQLKFFKKLELYQELKFQDKKAATKPEAYKVWKTEKEILKWTVYNHHYLNAGITHDFIRKNILVAAEEKLFEIEKEYDVRLAQTFSNLSKRGYIKLSDQRGDEMFLLKEGLLMGEVVYDVESGRGWKYFLFYWLTWATVWAGALSVIINFLKLIEN
jgi:hypothetical protein